MLLVHLFVCFARVCFCPFSLPLGVEGWLRFVIVAYSLDISVNFFACCFFSGQQLCVGTGRYQKCREKEFTDSIYQHLSKLTNEFRCHCIDFS